MALQDSAETDFLAHGLFGNPTLLPCLVDRTFEETDTKEFALRLPLWESCRFILLEIPLEKNQFQRENWSVPPQE